jgi:methionyl-tRNA formyltransferase
MVPIAARRAIRRGLKPWAILAPRHANERLLLSDSTLEQALDALDVRIRVTENINEPAARRGWPAPARSAAVCFGSAWIFSPEVLAAFGLGMFNVNAIPVPLYLGGAHYSWQIMNGDRRGGIAVQRVTRDLDRGPFVRRISFELPDTARTPHDYYRAYVGAASSVIEDLVDSIADGRTISETPFEVAQQDRVYFPRLLTAAQGFIDWRWDANEIERFCNAFDVPFAGAATYVNDVEVRLRSVRAVPQNVSVHPFAAGLIVRNLGKPVVAARGGWLELGSVTSTDGVMRSLKEGTRLHTPTEALERAIRFRARFGAKGVDNSKPGPEQ